MGNASSSGACASASSAFLLDNVVKLYHASTGPPVVEPTIEQKDRVHQVMVKGYVSKHHGKAAVTQVARAHDPSHTVNGYDVPAHQRHTSVWGSTTDLFTDCCHDSNRDAEFVMTVAADPVDYVDIAKTVDAKRFDPGPPQDAGLTPFLGPQLHEHMQSLPRPAAGDSPARYAYGYGGAAAPVPGTQGMSQYSQGGPGSTSTTPVAGSQQAGASPQLQPGYPAGAGTMPPGAQTMLAPGAGPSQAGLYGPRSEGPGGYSPLQPPPSSTGTAPYPLSEVPDSADPGFDPQALPPAGPALSEKSTALARAAWIGKGFKGRYALGKRLNAGAQGVTYLAKAKFSNRSVVVKKPNDARDTSDYNLLSKKSHPNIVRVYELFQDPVDTYIILEHCPGGDLFHAIEELKTPTQNWTAGVFRQILWGVRYLHEFFGESHNDIKPENIFLDRKPTGAKDVPRAMIGDFGCLAALGKATSGGDPRYRAPETFNRGLFGAATDMWSLGVTLYEIASGGQLIYIDEQNVSSWEKFRHSPMWDRFRREVMKGRPVNLSKIKGNCESTTEELKVLLRGLLDVRPNRRMTAEKALELPWLALHPEEREVHFTQGGSLKRRAQLHVIDVGLLNLVAGMLHGESLRHYQAIWQLYDTDHNGLMAKSEFRRMLEDLKAKGSLPEAAVGASDKPLPTVEDLFLLADKNHSGAIDFHEFCGLMFSPDQLSASERAECCKQAFASLAGDDGKISSKEFAGFFSEGKDHHEVKEDAEVISKLFGLMDTDKDGYISYTEFAKHIDLL